MDLLNGEELKLSNYDIQILSDSDLDDKFKRQMTNVFTDQARYPLDQVKEIFSNVEKMNLNPNYQRGSVWGYKEKSMLIESLLMNIPIPPIYLFEREFNEYEILDGKQRITAIVDFYNNKYRLEGLEIWPELNGKFYDDLSQTFKNGLNRRYITATIILKETYNKNDDLSLICLIFERLNSGGLELTPQESRNAIFNGPFNDMCKEIVGEETFRKAFNIKEKYYSLSLFDNPKCIEDVQTTKILYSEYPLRFFAYRQLDKLETNLKQFLGIYLQHANKFDSQLISELKLLYMKVLKLAYDIFEFPFRLSAKKSKISYLIYDPLMQVLTKYLVKSTVLVEKKEEIRDAFYKMLLENKKQFNGKFTHKKAVLKRMEIMDNFFRRYVEE
ncbi:MAG: DUF262 domain-containing protein [Bacilli bacterium]|nr:DUF262 domain-containing protein [Bacilli bacterium]